MSGTNGQLPRGPGSDHSRSFLQSSSHSSHPPSRSSVRYHFMKMAPPCHHASDSSSTLPPSPSLRQPQPALAHRYSLRKSSRGSMGSTSGDRPPTPISKISAKDSHSSSLQGPQSTFLQEKLQKERRSEIQRNLTRLTGDAGTALETKAANATPTRAASGDTIWQEQTPTTDDGTKKGLALKEMEQTMSTLHKQNFDLKLELFHRRERQSVLEDKIENLEAGRSQAEETNTLLIQEVEKRDKAIEEAVHMIVSLEARMELLLREREMIRQVEADSSLLSQLAQSPSTTLVSNEDTPKRHDATPSANKHSLTRMPSFVSQHTDNTENLRNVYLDSKASYMSLAKTDSRADNNGFVSPSMSMLSESSFLSVYGKGTARQSSSPSNIPDSVLRHGNVASGGVRSISMSSKNLMPSKPHQIDRRRSHDGGTQAVDPVTKSSSTHRFQNVEGDSLAQKAATQTAMLGTDIDRCKTIKPLKQQPLMRVRNDRDRPMRKIVMDEPARPHHTLPPTPDTASSSMLNQRQSIDDKIRHDTDSEQTRYQTLSRLTIDQTDDVEPGHWRFRNSSVGQPPSVTAFTGRKETPSAVYNENRSTPLRRPRSADETTISRHRNDWDSDSEADDAISEASSFDYWMKEGLRPSRGGTGRNKTRLGSPRFGSRRDPPDLFGFPSDLKGWQNSEMFGPFGGSNFLGAGAPLEPAEAGTSGSGLVDLDSSRPSDDPAGPPPAPYRRSSLQARTSAPGTPMIARGTLGGEDGVRKRSVSGNASTNTTSNGWPIPNSRSSTTAATGQQQAQRQDGTIGQKRHYPPQASQQQQTAARPRSRGITSLFRRSLGSSSVQPQPSASVPANQSPFPPPSKEVPQVAIGVPIWERRNDRMDDGPSATPPPIMRKRALTTLEGPENGATRVSMAATKAGKASNSTGTTPGLGSGLGSVMGVEDGGALLTTAENNNSNQESTSAPGSQGHGRKWFGLGRVTNLRNGGT